MSYEGFDAYLEDHKANYRFIVEILQDKLDSIEQTPEGKPVNRADVTVWRQLNFALIFMRGLFAEIDI